jgi:BMFP domain-containing protein YqiC
MALKDRFKDEMDTLRTVRDELNVQMHLAQAEARDRWDQLEKKWQHLEAKAQVVGEASRDSLDDIEEAGKLLLEEIREGYRSLKKLL